MLVVTIVLPSVNPCPKPNPKHRQLAEFRWDRAFINTPRQRQKYRKCRIITHWHTLSQRIFSLNFHAPSSDTFRPTKSQFLLKTAASKLCSVLVTTHLSTIFFPGIRTEARPIYTGLFCASVPSVSTGFRVAFLNFVRRYSSEGVDARVRGPRADLQ